MDGIVKATFVSPVQSDSDELKQRRMNEKNYNLKLKKVVEDALTLAIQLYNSNIVGVAGPYPEEKALELSNLLDQAYKNQLEPVQINPYMDKDKVNNKVSSNSKITVNDLFPITSAKMKKFMTTEKGRTNVKSILVVPKSLVITLVESETRKELQKVFEQRQKDSKD